MPGNRSANGFIWLRQFKNNSNLAGSIWTRRTMPFPPTAKRSEYRRILPFDSPSCDTVRHSATQLISSRGPSQALSPDMITLVRARAEVPLLVRSAFECGKLSPPYRSSTPHVRFAASRELTLAYAIWPWNIPWSPCASYSANER